MTPAIELTSVPPWALRPTTEPRDPVATSLSVFAVGTAAAEVARAWTDRTAAVMIASPADFSTYGITWMASGSSPTADATRVGAAPCDHARPPSAARGT